MWFMKRKELFMATVKVIRSPSLKAVAKVYHRFKLR